jgi:hypothetical protein
MVKQNFVNDQKNHCGNNVVTLNGVKKTAGGNLVE